MLDALLAILTGGATGLLGTAISAGIGYFERRQRHQQELELRQVDLEISRAESASAERIVAVEAESEESARSWSAFEASHRASTVRWSSGDSGWLVVVDVVRGLIRPVLTLGFVATSCAIYFTLPISPSADAGDRLVDTVLYLATTTTLWWFGTRPKRTAT